MIERQKFMEKKLHDYVDILEESMCNRCMFHRYGSKKWTTNHHQGKLYIELFNNRNVTDDKIQQWMFDKDHGLLHCFLVGFFAYFHIVENTDYTHDQLMTIIRKGSFEDNWFERLLAACFLHDFARCDGEDNHDKNLKKYYPKLAREAYTHSNPSKETPLVIGDRIELRRFADWKSWSNVDIRKYTTKYEREVNYFYSSMRPALTRLFDNRYGLWASHGAEAKTDFSQGVFPQGLEDKLIMRIMNITERFVERLTMLVR